MKMPMISTPAAMACLVVAVSLNASAAKPTIQAGGNPYRVSAAPATGRSGSATITARALLDKDGETLLEVSTAELDSGTPAPGNISKLQVKLLDSAGNVRAVTTENGLKSGGRLQRVLQGLGRGQPLQIQANVRGIDGNRTDVVTVATEVRRRPDLAVLAVAAPEQVQAAVPVNISAQVSELNGDVGAEADCVLKINGVEVDRAPGIWVDAGDVVSCAFAHTFQSGGTHTVSVGMVDIVPGDDDPTNDQASTTVQVSASQGFRHYASVGSWSWTRSAQSDGWYKFVSTSTTVNADWSSSWKQSGWQQTVHLRAELDESISFPLTRFELEHQSGGQAIPGVVLSGVAADWTYNYPTWLGTVTVAGAWRVDPTTAANVTIYSQQSPSGNRATITFTRYGGEVTYFSTSYSATWITDHASGATYSSSYMYNSSATYSLGNAAQWTEGPTYDFDVQIINGSTQYHAAPQVVLRPHGYHYVKPYGCATYSGTSYSMTSCYGHDQQMEGVHGSVIGGP